MHENRVMRHGGFEFTSRETGVEPDIHPSVLMDAMVDCIHKVTIEAYAFSGHDVLILTGSHDPYVFGPERRTTTKGGPVHIKEGAWLGTRCIIVGPVTIGRHAVVAAGAVVVDDVPDYALVAGVPARVKKFYPHDGDDRPIVMGESLYAEDAPRPRTRWTGTHWERE